MTVPCPDGQHDKCYDHAVLLANPPVMRWICRRCKAQGTERGPAVDYGEYDRLVREAEKSNGRGDQPQD